MEGIQKELPKPNTNNQGSFIKKAVLLAGLALVSPKASSQTILGNNDPKEREKIERMLLTEKDSSLEKILIEYNTYIQTSSFFSKYPQAFMSYTAASERPNDYQAKQMVELVDTIVAQVQARKFTDTLELLKFINAKLSPDFSVVPSSLFLKDAFSESEGTQPKGSFDCDSRSVMISSVFQSLGIEYKNYAMYYLETHMLMYDNSEKKFFETTANMPRELTIDEKAQVTPINTSQEYIAYLLENQGLKLVDEISAGNPLDRKEDTSKARIALSLFLKTIDLYPNATMPYVNALTVLGRLGVYPLLEEMMYKRFLSNLVLNYHTNVNSNEIAKSEKKDDDSKRKLEAVQGSSYVRDKFYDYGLFAYNYSNNYPEAIKTFSLLIESFSKEQRTEPEAIICRRLMLDAYFDEHDFKSYLSLVDEVISVLSQKRTDEFAPYYEQFAEEQKAQKLVAEIVTGKFEINKKNIEGIIAQYKDDPALGPVISGEENWQNHYNVSGEILKNWHGYKHLKKLLMEHTEAKK